ncbi:DNA internalization-related competence protein ComEC/Rec2 [Variovorax sp. VNK109]|uniref:DNA internalization-related competence protein ComEC/Rec2 n=1 Tax=Variovorax sp. VNK109 TaxID=3400919 RepID=UPI003C02CC47
MHFHETNNDWPTDALWPAMVGWVAGTAIHLQLASLPNPVVLTLWLIAGVLGWLCALFCASKWRGPQSGHRRQRRQWLGVVVILLAQVALAFSLCGLRASHFASGALPAALEGQDLRIVGVVAAMPQRQEDGTRMRFDVEHATLRGQVVRLPPLIDIGWYAQGAAQPVPELVAGDRWELTVRLKRPHGHRNPHGVDYELWLWEQGVQANGYVRTGAGDNPRRLASSWSKPVERLRQSVRDDILAAVDSPRAAGVVAALAVGDQRAIERADWDVFRATGVAHLMSISGLHITMFAWLAAAVTAVLWRRSARLCLVFPAPLASLVLGVSMAAAYAVFSGWGVPSQRTVLMLATVALLRLCGRRWPWPHVWLLACCVVLAVDPWALLQAGFWLSFVAVGVLFATDPGGGHKALQGAAADNSTGSLLHAFRERAWQLLREQWIVTLALAPLGLLLFQQMSVVGLLANLIAIPWVTLLVTPLSLAGCLWAPLWVAAAGCVQALGWLLGQMAAWPLATFSMAASPWWVGAAGVLGGAVLVMRLPWVLRMQGVVLLLPLVLWQPARPAQGQFELIAADVGQGNAVLVRTAAHTLVYDTGPRFSRESDAGHRVLVPLLRALGERVDRVVLSHRDIDHTGGAPAVLAMQPQADLYASIEPEHELQAIRPATRCEAGQQWTWDGVRFEMLHPQPQDYEARAKSNALSCVLRISSGGAAALLAGDIELAQERALVASDADLKADVLLVPHHGSKTSSSPAFISAVAPTLAVVQAGYRNRFGHPAPEIRERYESQGIHVATSPECGAARWASSAPGQLHCERNVARRYWHHEARKLLSCRQEKSDPC